MFSEPNFPPSLKAVIIDQIDKKPHLLLPRNFHFESLQKEKEAGQKLKEFYFGNESICSETADNLVNVS